MYLKERSRGRNNKDLQVKEHFRVLIASDLISCIKKCRPEWNGIFDGAPEAIRTPDARFRKPPKSVGIPMVTADFPHRFPDFP